MYLCLVHPSITLHWPVNFPQYVMLSTLLHELYKNIPNYEKFNISTR